MSEEFPKTFEDTGDIGVFFSESALLRGYRTSCYKYGVLLGESKFDHRATVVVFQKMNEDNKEDGSPLIYHKDSIKEDDSGWHILEPAEKTEASLDEDEDLEYEVSIEVTEKDEADI